MPLALLEKPFHHRNSQDGSTKTTEKQVLNLAQFQSYFHSTLQGLSTTTTLAIVGTTTKFSTKKALGNNISPTETMVKSHCVTLCHTVILKIKGNAPVNKSTRTTSVKNTASKLSTHLFFIFFSQCHSLMFFQANPKQRESSFYYWKE